MNHPPVKYTVSKMDIILLEPMKDHRVTYIKPAKKLIKPNRNTTNKLAGIAANHGTAVYNAVYGETPEVTPVLVAELREDAAFAAKLGLRTLAHNIELTIKDAVRLLEGKQVANDRGAMMPSEVDFLVGMNRQQRRGWLSKQRKAVTK